MAKLNSTIFKQKTIKSWFSGVGNSVNNEVIQPFQNASSVIDKYNQAIQHNSLTQQGWKKLLAQSDDSLKAYLTSVKGSTASMTAYNVSLQGSVTGFKKVYSAITQYNTLSASGSVEQNTFATAVSVTNTRLGTYLTGLNGAKASLGGYIISLVGATAKTIILKAATIALNTAVTMGASLIISGIVSAISEWINKTENMIEASEDAVEKIKSINEELKNNQKTISETAKRYAELEQGVDQLTGKNISLSNEDYEEFLSLSNQLAEMFPTLTRNYNSNGDAIIQLSGDVDTIVGSLQNLIEAQRDLTNRQIVDELPTVFDGVAEKSDRYESELENLEDKKKALLQVLNDFNIQDVNKKIKTALNNKYIEIASNDVEEYVRLVDNYTELLKNSNLEYSLQNFEPKFNGYGNDGEQILSYKTSIYIDYENIDEAETNIDTTVNDLLKQYENELEDLNEQINVINKKNKVNWTSLSSSIYAWLSTDDSFKVMDDTMQATVQNIVNSIDWGSLDFSSWKDAKQYIQDNILSLFNTADGKEVLADIQVMFGIQTQFNNGDITVEKYQTKLQEFLASIESLPPESKKSIMLLFGIETNEDGTTTSSVDTMIANVEKKLKGTEFDDRVGELSLGDLQIAADLEVPDDSIQSWDDLLERIQERKNLNSVVPDILSETQIKNIEEYQLKLKSLYEALNLLRSGEMSGTDISKLILDFPKLSGYEDSMENLEEHIETLINDYLLNLKKAFGDVADESLKGISAMAVRYDALTDAIDTTTSAIDNITSSYKSLIEAIDEYNEKGHISLETLETIMKLEPQYLAALMDEEGHIVANTYAYRDLLIVRLKELKAKALSMTSNLAEAYINGEISKEEYEKQWKAAAKDRDVLLKFIDSVDVDDVLKDIENGSSSSSTNSVLDWVEIKINSIKEAIEELKDEANDPFKSWADRSGSLQKVLKDTKSLKESYGKAAQVYLDKANSVGLSSTYASLVQSGSWSISDVPKDITSDEYEKIEEYQKWWDAYQDVVSAQKDVARELNELTQDNFDNILDEFDAKLSHYENTANLIESKLANAESKGYIATQSYYTTLKAIESVKKAELEKQLSELTNALNSTDFETDSEAWSELTGEIETTELAIQEATNAMQEFDNEMRQIEWDLFDFSREQESKLIDEVDFMVDLLDSAKMFSEVGEITAEGMATMGLHAQNYNSYLEQAVEYAEELKDIQKNLTEDEYNTDLIERRNELLELQQESIIASEDEKDAMIELVSEGIELQKEAFQDLIQEYTEALDVQKDLYDYQKKNSEQTKKIANLQKQLAAYSGDNSDEARAKVQQLKVELENAQNDLESDQYDKYISDQKEILSSIQEDYETALDTYLEDTARVITDSINTVNKNATDIGKTLKTKTEEVGYDVTTAMKDIWTKEEFELGNGFKDVTTNVLSENGTLTNIREDVNSLIDGQKDAIVGELEELTGSDSHLSNLSGIKSILESIYARIGEIGTGSLNTTSVNQEDINQPTNSIDGKEPKVNTSNSGNFVVGETLSNVTGKWYAASDGTGNSGSVTPKGGADNWIIEKINEGSAYPYHIISYKNGQKTGSGWVKRTQLAYKKGAKRIGENQFAWTQEDGTEYIIRPSDGAILTPLAQGDSVLTSEASQNLWNMANNPIDFIKNSLITPIPNIAMNTPNRTIENTVQMSINLPGVTNYQDFVNQLQSDKKFEKMIVDVTSSALTGSNSLSKYRHKF